MRRKKSVKGSRPVTIEEYMRTQVLFSDWTQKSDHCYITGQRSGKLTVHHTDKSFYAILHDSLEVCSIQYRRLAVHYTSVELALLKNEVIRQHKLYAKCVTLDKTIHDDLHNRFGREISMDQIEAYKAEYNNLRVAM